MTFYVLFALLTLSTGLTVSPTTSPSPSPSCSASPGYFCSGGSALICPIGAYCAGGSATATSCQRGTYSITSGATNCAPCAAYTYTSFAGAALCSTYNRTLWNICTPVRYVRISQSANTYLNFGELLVLNGSSNLARNKPTSQSSTYPASSCCSGAQSGAQVSSYAVDENICTFAGTNNAANSWWEVDLLAAYSVNATVFYNRNDDVSGAGFSSRMNGAVLTFSDADGAVITSVQLPAVRVLMYAIGFCVPCPASFYCFSGAPVLCPAGSYCPLSSIHATLCSKGSYSNAGASNCTLCPAGTFTFTTGSTSCQQCPGGHYCPTGTSSWASLNCGRGNYCPDGSGAPTPCPFQVPPTGGWGALQVQGPAFLVETAHCLNHCFWNFTSGDGMLSKC